MKRNITHLQLDARTRRAADVLAAMKGKSLSDYFTHLVEKDLETQGLQHLVDKQVEEDGHE